MRRGAAWSYGACCASPHRLELVRAGMDVAFRFGLPPDGSKDWHSPFHHPQTQIHDLNCRAARPRR
jgi:hypothetical protein